MARRSSSLVRLLRWLGAGTPTAAILLKRAKKSIKHCPEKAGRQLGLLHTLTADVHAAANVLAQAPGLGWSCEDHPGHVLFPTFAGLLAEGTRARLSAELFPGLQDTPRDPLEMDCDSDDGTKPKLTTSSIAELIASVGPGASIDFQGRAAMLDGMRAAATKRVAGVLGNKRRRNYLHAATLVVCCLDLAPVVGKHKAISDWVAKVRKKYSRFHAFQEELKSALASISS